MGYPMDYRRVIARNGLSGDYTHNDPTRADDGRRMIAGDLRRLEADQRDANHLPMYAKAAGITAEQARTVLDCFFEHNLPYGEWANRDDPFVQRQWEVEQLQQRVSSLESWVQAMYNVVRMQRKKHDTSIGLLRVQEAIERQATFIGYTLLGTEG